MPRDTCRGIPPGTFRRISHGAPRRVARIRPLPAPRALLAAAGAVALVLATTPGTPALTGATLPVTHSPAACALPVSDGHDGLNEAIPMPAAGGAAAYQGGTGTGAGAASSGYAPATGTVSALTLFIDFPGAEATLSTHERFAEFFPATTRYFAVSSGGQLRYQPVPVHRWLRMSQPFEAYGIDRGTGWHPDDPQGYNRLMGEIVAALADDVDFAAYDLVNVLATPEAGPPATEKVLSVTFPGRPLVATPSGPLHNVSFIWSHQPGESPHRVLVHENGHAFGLPDLYWTGPGTALPLTGHWDVMEQDWGPSNDLLAWHKWKLGWLDPAEVACVRYEGVTEYVLTPTDGDDWNDGGDVGGDGGGDGGGDVVTWVGTTTAPNS